jgi:hypothetical protein
MRQPQSGLALMAVATDVQSDTQASTDEQTPYSSEDSMEPFL